MYPVFMKDLYRTKVELFTLYVHFICFGVNSQCNVKKTHSGIWALKEHTRIKIRNYYIYMIIPQSVKIMFSSYLQYTGHPRSGQFDLFTKVAKSF